MIELIPSTAIGQSPHPTKALKKRFYQIDYYLQRQIDSAKKSPVAGIAIAIVKGKELVHLKAFGVVNRETKQGLKPDHTFHVASISKTFAATAILHLAEQSKLRLDEKLTHYLPNPVRRLFVIRIRRPWRG